MSVTTSSVMTRIKQLAREAYEECASNSEPWNLESVLSEVSTKVADEELDEEIREYVVQQQVLDYDKRRREQLNIRQISLLTLDEESLDGVLALGSADRVKLRYAEVPDLDKWYELQLEQYTATTVAHSQKTTFYRETRSALVKRGNHANVGDLVASPE